MTAARDIRYTLYCDSADCDKHFHGQLGESLAMVRLRARSAFAWTGAAPRDFCAAHSGGES